MVDTEVAPTPEVKMTMWKFLQDQGTYRETLAMLSFSIQFRLTQLWASSARTTGITHLKCFHTRLNNPTRAQTARNRQRLMTALEGHSEELILRRHMTLSEMISMIPVETLLCHSSI
jgi:hypothetical protein